MKAVWKAMALISILACGLVMAQNEDDTNADPAAPPPIPPIPPKVPNEEPMPTVVIRETEDERIEEYSQNGRVYMVKITPIKGPAYYYLDENGDGQLELQPTDKGEGPVRPVYWKLKEW